MPNVKINRILKYILVMSAVFSFTVSEGQQIFQKEYLGGSIQGRILENSSGYFFASHKILSGGYGRQILIYHIDHAGSIIWAKHLGKISPITEFVNDYTFSNDSSEIIFVGNRSNGTSNFANILIFKLDINGNLIWHKILNDSLSNKAYAIYNYNAFYYVTGQIFANTTNNQGGLGFVLKLDENGNVISNNFYTTMTNNPILLLGVIRKFNYLYLVGNLFNITTHENDILFMKTDTLGNILLSKIIGTSSQDYIGSMIMDHDNNNFILTGTTYGYTYPTRFQIKITGDGDILWTRIIDIGNSTSADWLGKTKDDGFIFGTASAIIVKTDSLFNINWTSKFAPGWLVRGFHSAIETNDGGIIAGGVINNTLSSLIVKIDSLFDGGCNQTNHTVMSYNFNFIEDTIDIIQAYHNLLPIGDSLPNYNLTGSPVTYCQTATGNFELPFREYSLFPNPFYDSFKIKFGYKVELITSVKFVNLLGEFLKPEYYIQSNNSLLIFGEKIPPGLYYLQIEFISGQMFYSKIIKS